MEAAGTPREWVDTLVGISILVDIPVCQVCASRGIGRDAEEEALIDVLVEFSVDILICQVCASRGIDKRYWERGIGRYAGGGFGRYTDMLADVLMEALRETLVEILVEPRSHG